MGLKPFSFSEDPLTRKYTNLGSISNKTLKKYMLKMTLIVEKEISKILPEKFALIIDGWSCGTTHFVGIFESYPSDSLNGYDIVMLGFMPLIDETCFSAINHYELI